MKSSSFVSHFEVVFEGVDGDVQLGEVDEESWRMKIFSFSHVCTWLSSRRRWTEVWVSRCLSNFASDMIGFVSFALSALNSPDVMQPKRLFKLWNNSLNGMMSRVCAGPAAPRATSSRLVWH